MDRLTEQTTLALKENETFFFLPAEGNRFYPFSKNFIQRALSVYKKYFVH